MKGAIYYEAIATVIFSHVKISGFRVKAHLVFHWFLHDKLRYETEQNIKDVTLNATALTGCEALDLQV